MVSTNVVRAGMQVAIRVERAVPGPESPTMDSPTVKRSFGAAGLCRVARTARALALAVFECQDGLSAPDAGHLTALDRATSAARSRDRARFCHGLATSKVLCHPLAERESADFCHLAEKVANEWQTRTRRSEAL